MNNIAPPWRMQYVFRAADAVRPADVSINRKEPGKGDVRSSQDRSGQVKPCNGIGDAAEKQMRICGHVP